jgi:phosphohistidine phosphatase
MAAEYRIYLVRHAIAADRGTEYPDDSKRPLTPKGARKFKEVARGFALLEPDVDIILTSPYVRARQTAEILSEALPGSPKVIQTKAMTPEATFIQFSEELGGHAGREVMALVGHEPSISAFAAKLIGAKGLIEFKKGAIARIDVASVPPAHAGRLVWLIPPRVFSVLVK